MSRRFSRLSAIAALAALTCTSAPSLLGAAETFDYGIVTTVADDKGQPKLLNLESGDLLRSGARFRVELLTHAAGTLDVIFESAQGEEIVLAQGVPVGAGDRLSLPSDKDWYRLDDFEGVERLKISLSRETRRESAEHVIRHVAPELFQVTRGLEDLASEGGPAAATEGQVEMLDEAAGQRIIGTLAGLPRSVAGYRSALARLTAKDDALTRGAKEAKLFRELSPGVVMIVNDQGVGSGVIISEEGLIVTNWHVIQGSEAFGIIFKPPLGQEIKPSSIYLGVIEKVDPELDLALVRVINPPETMTILELGEMRDIEVGSDVHAIGHPTGEGWTYTKGLISQIRPNYRWPSPLGFSHKAMVIQTQTPISPGSSGSPLISEDYKIVGINSFKKEGEALNFAVSVADIRAFLSEQGSQPAAPVSLLPESENCESPSKRKDTSSGGQADRIMVDTDCDGRVDLVIVDEDNDGQPDFALADRDGDGKPDLKMISTAKDGRFDLWLFDSDGDGSLDMVGYDEDFDGIIDRYTRG